MNADKSRTDDSAAPIDTKMLFGIRADREIKISIVGHPELAAPDLSVFTRGGPVVTVPYSNNVWATTLAAGDHVLRMQAPGDQWFSSAVSFVLSSPSLIVIPGPDNASSVVGWRSDVGTNSDPKNPWPPPQAESVIDDPDWFLTVLPAMRKMVALTKAMPLDEGPWPQYRRVGADAGKLPAVLLIAIAGVLVGVTPARADDDHCRDLLVHGIYDQSREFTQNQSSSAIDKQLCETYNRYVQDVAAGSVQLSYGLFGGGASLSREAIESVGKAMCSHDSSSAMSANLVDRGSSLLNAGAIQAWRDCVAAREQRGLQSTWRFREEDQAFVSLEIEYIPPAGGVNEIKINKIMLQPALGLSCDGELLKFEGKSIKASTRYSLSCTRTVYPQPRKSGALGWVFAEPATIQINTAAGQLRADWRAIRPPAPRVVSTLPVGSVISYVGKLGSLADVPAGWLVCDGAEYKKSQYPDLFATLGTSYGTATSSEAFKVPDLRGHFLRGFDPSGTIDKGANGRVQPDGKLGNTIGSSETSATSRPQTPFTTSVDGNHSHGMDLELTAGRSDGRVHNTVANPWCCGSPQRSTQEAGAHSHSVTGGGDPETRPVNTAVVYLVKALREAPVEAAPKMAVSLEHAN